MRTSHIADRTSQTHQRGAAAVLAMMFLVIFGSLAAAMAIVSQGNLSTADAQLKINRSLAAAETGLNFIEHRLAKVAQTVDTREGVITSEVAAPLWDEVRSKLLDEFSGEMHNESEPRLDGDTLHVGPIAVGPSAPKFTATLTPHPLAGEDYNSDYYDRAPYNELNPPVSGSAPLGSEWIRVRVTASDGPASHEVTRSIAVDFRMTKRIPYAILSKSRVMLGRNVMVQGPIGSSFTETDLEDGHPIHMLSDFSGLSDDLDADLDALTGTLITNDINGDNRILVSSETETDGMSDPEQFDVNNDGYIDDYDFFLANVDSDNNGAITELELENEADDAISGRQLFELIDTAGYGPGDPPPNWQGAPEDYPGRPGYNDGVIDEQDRYAKIRGEVHITADVEGWETGSADPDGDGEGSYQDFFAGAIHPGNDTAPVNFESSKNAVYEFGPEDFDVSEFRERATGKLYAQADQELADKYDPDDPTSPQPLGQQVTESVPFQAAHPYDYYDRPVFENMTFENVSIPKGTNALFRNCTFIGVTFIETTTDNTHDNFNKAGIQEEDGEFKHPDLTVPDADNDGTNHSTKDDANNIRFEGCTFEGAVVSDAPSAYTQVRNKLAFTGKTRFNIEDSDHLSSSEKQLYKRSTILAPHYSVEMGTFISPYDNDETVKLSGTIVAGLIDMRGQVRVNGTILTTFQPESNTGPVAGDTSPWFNTTLGYFGSDSGDREAEVPESGLGVIHLRYDPTLPLPDGVLGPIQIEPAMRTYTEGGG